MPATCTARCCKGWTSSPRLRRDEREPVAVERPLDAVAESRRADDGVAQLRPHDRTVIESHLDDDERRGRLRPACSWTAAWPITVPADDTVASSARGGCAAPFAADRFWRAPPAARTADSGWRRAHMACRTSSHHLASTLHLADHNIIYPMVVQSRVQPFEGGERGREEGEERGGRGEGGEGGRKGGGGRGGRVPPAVRTLPGPPPRRDATGGPPRSSAGLERLPVVLS